MINMNCSFSHSSEPPAGTRKVNPPMHLLLVCSAYADICKLLTSQRCSSTSTLYRLTDNAIKDSLSLLLFFFCIFDFFLVLSEVQPGAAAPWFLFWLLLLVLLLRGPWIFGREWRRGEITIKREGIEQKGRKRDRNQSICVAKKM